MSSVGRGTMRQPGIKGAITLCTADMTRSTSVRGTSIAGDSSKRPCIQHSHFDPDTVGLFSSPLGMANHCNMLQVDRMMLTAQMEGTFLTVSTDTMPPMDTPAMNRGAFGS